MNNLRDITDAYAIVLDEYGQGYSIHRALRTLRRMSDMDVLESGRGGDCLWG